MQFYPHNRVDAALTFCCQFASPQPQAKAHGHACPARVCCAPQGIIHRDVKPQNCMLSASDGKLCLIDFGLAVNNREERANTAAGTVVRRPGISLLSGGRVHLVIALDVGCVRCRALDSLAGPAIQMACSITSRMQQLQRLPGRVLPPRPELSGLPGQFLRQCLGIVALISLEMLGLPGL
jgi:serine/threonine protein kinase